MAKLQCRQTYKGNTFFTFPTILLNLFILCQTALKWGSRNGLILVQVYEVILEVNILLNLPILHTPYSIFPSPFPLLPPSSHLPPLPSLSLKNNISPPPSASSPSDTNPTPPSSGASPSSTPGPSRAPHGPGPAGPGAPGRHGYGGRYQVRRKIGTFASPPTDGSCGGGSGRGRGDCCGIF